MSLSSFASQLYQDHNRARLEHLATLDLPLTNRSVLEVGSGPGDHTGFFLERGCTVVSTDSRQECCDALTARYPSVQAHTVDMNCPDLSRFGTFEVVYCYGLLYHLENPTNALSEMSKVCSELLLLETCVSHYPSADKLNIVPETADFTQSSTGKGCRPDRRWLFDRLKTHFEYVYQSRSQPRHREFPLDWTQPPTGLVSRAVFVASRKPLEETRLSPSMLERHI